MFSKDGMEKVAQYADGIGPWTPMLIDDKSKQSHLIIKPLMEYAKKAGLVVHPYTFRADPGTIPPYAKDFEDMIQIFVNKVRVDGVFSDFPDRARQAIVKQ